MKPRWQKQREGAMTRMEVVVVIAIVALLMFILYSGKVASLEKAQRINCVINLKQVNLSFRIWEGDNNSHYPMSVSTSLGGAMELVAANNVAACFQVMSNELSTPIILICPSDSKRVPATNFNSDFNTSHISYFIGIDATNEANPQRLLSGDDNFQIDGNPVGSGVLLLSSNIPMEWGPDRHRHVGNLGFADGSVAEVSDGGLQSALQQTGLATNQLAIP